MNQKVNQEIIAPIITNDILCEEVSPLLLSTAIDSQMQTPTPLQKTTATESLKNLAFTAKQKFVDATNSDSVQNLKQTVGAKLEATRNYFSKEKQPANAENTTQENSPTSAADPEAPRAGARLGLQKLSIFTRKALEKVSEGTKRGFEDASNSVSAQVEKVKLLLGKNK